MRALPLLVTLALLALRGPAARGEEVWVRAAPAPARPDDAAGEACARHVNRLLAERVGWRVRGNAWDLQLLPSNRAALELRWSIVGSVHYRQPPWALREGGDDDALLLARAADRVEHFRALYATLDRAPTPAGVVGFAYRFSRWRERIAAALPRVLAQTHIVLVERRERFALVNDALQPRALSVLLRERLGGGIRAEERRLIEARLGAPLARRLGPGERHVFEDYLVLQHFVRQRRGPLLEMLRKLPADRQTPMFRPVSYSRLAVRPAR